MIELADALYSRILEGVALLALNPVECSAVGLLQLFSAGLIASLTVYATLEVQATAQLRRRSERWDDPRILGAFATAVEACGVGRRPKLFVASAEESGVFTSGYFRPSVHLSRAVANALERDELQAVFRHELAHVARRDNAAGAIVRIGSVFGFAIVPFIFVLAFVFAHETLHLGSFEAKSLQVLAVTMILLTRRFVWRAFAASREMRCDDQAVEHGADPVALASAIVKTLTLQSQPQKWRISGAPSAALAENVVERRLQRLLEERGPHRKRGVWSTRILVAAVALSLVFAASYHVRGADGEKPPLPWSGISPP